MMSVLASLSLNKDGSFEVQFNNADEPHRLLIVCGQYRNECEKDHGGDCDGLKLGDSVSIFNQKAKMLLDATDLISLVAILSKSDVECFTIEYYAIVSSQTSQLIAEHHIIMMPRGRLFTKYESLVVVVSGRAITLETLKRNCILHGHPDGYALTLWRSYRYKRNSGQDRSDALSELVRICFTDSEIKSMIGKEIKEK